MGIAHRTGGRILSKGYTAGKAKGTMAMDRFPFNGMLMTSSLNSLITDSRARRAQLLHREQDQQRDGGGLPGQHRG